jgi:hypothetical protein
MDAAPPPSADFKIEEFLSTNSLEAQAYVSQIIFF